MKKKVQFYKLILEKTNQLNIFEDTNITLQDKVKQLKDNYDNTDLLQVNENKVFTLIDFCKDYIFGTFGKLDDIKIGSHIRGRNRSNYNVESIENLIETYTYFYLDLSTNKVALLNNSTLPDIKKPFNHFIGSHFRVSSIYDVISLEPLLSKKFSTNYGEVVPIGKMNITYASDQLPKNEFINIKETMALADSEIRSVNIKFQMEQGVQKNKGALTKFRKKYQFEQLSVENDEEIIDLLDDIVIEKIAVEINSDDINNQEEIKDKLSSLLTDIDSTQSF